MINLSKIRQIDKRWIAWVVYFLLEYILLRRALSNHMYVPAEPLEQWKEAARTAALSAATASTGAMILALASWRMRWSMRPKILRIVSVLLLISGMYISFTEWRGYFFYSK